VHFDAYLAQTRGEQVPSTVTAKKGGATYNNFDTNSQVMYSVTPDAPENVPAIVTGSLGAGRVQHGDFRFTFTNSDDSSYDLNQQLVAAIAAYTSSLDSIFGETLSPTDTTSSDTTHHGGTGDHECYIINGAPTSSFYTFTSCSFASGKGTVTVDGTTYTECVKMESATNISFTTDQEYTLFLAFDKATANIKIDGTKVVATNGTISYPLAAGSHALTKADSNNLYYINLYGNQSALRNTEESGLGFDGTSILNPQGKLVRLYTMNGACLGSTTSTVIGTENLPTGYYVAVTASGSMKFRKN
jgi:pectate lyase